MALTPEQWQALIVTELGSITIVSANIATYWALAEDAPDDGTRYLVAKLQAIDLLLGQSARQVSFRALDGASVNLSDMFTHLVQLRGLVSAALSAGAAAGQSGGALGEITKTAPIMAPAGSPDANAQTYRGDAYGNPWRRRR